MDVITKQCTVCGSRGRVFDVDALGFTLWQGGLKDIQDALPSLTADERELLMTGTHAHCWERMWDGFSDE
jgi:hypothetical protein